MFFKSYLRKVLLVSFIMAFLIAITNFFVDPGSIYQKYNFSTQNQTSKEFVRLAVESKYGVFRPENIFNERDIVRELAIYPVNYDCAIIGSSHVKQMSLLRNNKSLSSYCKSIKNFGASGASLEDYLAISNMILNNEFKPKKVIFGIDLWSLNFGRDKRYVQYKKDYLSMINLLNNSENVEKSQHKGEFISIFFNLFNLEYFYRSLNEIIEPNFSKEIMEAPQFEFEKGLPYDVIMPDGSLVYSSQVIKEAEIKLENLDGLNDYKLVEGSYFQDYAVGFFIELVKYLQKNNIEVFFVLIPYHHSVISNESQPILKTIDKVTTKIYDLAKLLQVNVIGSYDPNVLQCTKDEFYGETHPKASCLKKLDNKIELNEK